MNRKGYDYRYANRPTKKELQQVLKEKTQSEAARMYGVLPDTVRRWEKKYGIYKSRLPQRGIHNPSASELYRLTPAEAASKYGVSKATVYRWRVKRKMQSREEQSILKKEVEQLKRQLYWEQFRPAFVVLTDAELARAWNLSRERVRQIRQKYEIPKCFREKGKLRRRLIEE